MLNPWLAITFQAIRLGFEAQNAMALRMMRLVGDVSKTAAGGMIADKRETVTKVHKKRVRANRRRHSNNRGTQFHRAVRYERRPDRSLLRG
jgi:hypothetical protein